MDKDNSKQELLHIRSKVYALIEWLAKEQDPVDVVKLIVGLAREFPFTDNYVTELEYRMLSKMAEFEKTFKQKSLNLVTGVEEEYDYVKKLADDKYNGIQSSDFSEEADLIVDSASKACPEITYLFPGFNESKMFGRDSNWFENTTPKLTPLKAIAFTRVQKLLIIAEFIAKEAEFGEFTEEFGSYNYEFLSNHLNFSLTEDGMPLFSDYEEFGHRVLPVLYAGSAMLFSPDEATLGNEANNQGYLFNIGYDLQGGDSCILVIRSYNGEKRLEQRKSPRGANKMERDGLTYGIDGLICSMFLLNIAVLEAVKNKKIQLVKMESRSLLGLDGSLSAEFINNCLNRTRRDKVLKTHAGSELMHDICDEIRARFALEPGYEILALKIIPDDKGAHSR